LALGPGTPRTFDDLLNLDVPQLALHVVTFTDGTLVSVNFNHATSDLGGLVAILNAWKLILAGRPQDVPKFRGYRTDPMAGLYESTPKEKSLVVDSFLSGWKMIYWALGHMWSSHWAPFEFRVVSIPRHVIDAFLERSRREALSEDDDTGNGSGTGFISENDVIVALCNRLMAQTMDRSRLIVTLVPIDPRGRAKTVFEADAAYVQNTPSAAFFQCSVAEAQDLALGKLAVRSRAAVTAQATEEQLKAAAVAVYASFKKTGNAPLAGTPTSALLCVTNWGKSGILEKTDFSPAIVKPSSRQRDGAKPGHPVWFHSDSLDPGSFATSIVGVMGRDLDRNLWLYGSFPTPTWDALIGFLEE
jgi:hypothetical protein